MMPHSEAWLGNHSFSRIRELVKAIILLTHPPSQELGRTFCVNLGANHYHSSSVTNSVLFPWEVSTCSLAPEDITDCPVPPPTII